MEHENAVAVTTAAAGLSAPGGVEEVLDAVKRSGASIDILVNNAGLGIVGLLPRQNCLS